MNSNKPNFSDGITPNMIYKWKIDGNSYTLFFDPDDSVYRELINYLYQKFYTSVIKIRSKNPLEFVKVNSGDVITSVDITLSDRFMNVIPKPIAIADGFVSVYNNWHNVPNLLEKGAEILSIHPTIPDDPNMPLYIKSEMIFRWDKVDKEEYKLMFSPNREVANARFCISRYEKFRKNRYYELEDVYTTINDIKTWFVVYAYRKEYCWNSKCFIGEVCKYVYCPPMIKEINREGVMKFAFTNSWIDSLISETHILTIYTGSKAYEHRLEQENQDEENRRYRQQIIEQEEKEKIKQKLIKRQRKRDLEKQVLHEMMDNGELYGEQLRRPSIPREVVDAVYRRDRGRCVYCGSTENIQLDHIIPFSRGGATTIENLQLLCQKCNLEKSNKIG